MSRRLIDQPDQPAPRKRGKYAAFLEADCGYSFAEWLGIETPTREYGRYWSEVHGMIRLKSSRATGEWSLTVKAATASYKKALKARRSR